MKETEVTAHLTEDAKRILSSHLKVGPDKPVSYLPIKTVEKIIGISVPAYRSMIENMGNQCSVFVEEECCINSGAVFAYSEEDLYDIIRQNRSFLAAHGWPIVPAEFIRRIASEWLEDESPIMRVVKEAFGER